MRSKYMLSEYENVKDGKAVQHPSQFSGGAGEPSTISFIPIIILLLLLSIGTDSEKDLVIKRHWLCSKMSAVAP